MVTQDRFKKSLTELGLSSSEAAVYLALVEYGASSVVDIARLSGIKRTTVYSIIERLMAQGFVVKGSAVAKQKFVATNPEVVHALLKQRVDSLQKFLPDLTALFNQKGSSGDTKILHGVQACKGAYEQLLQAARPRDSYLVISNVDRWLDLAPEYFAEFVKRRATLGLRPKHIFSASVLAKRWQNEMRKLGASAKLLPTGITFSVNLVIIPQLVVIHQLVAPVQAVVIENPIIAEMLSSIHAVLWQALGEQES